MMIIKPFKFSLTKLIKGGASLPILQPLQIKTPPLLPATDEVVVTTAITSTTTQRELGKL